MALSLDLLMACGACGREEGHAPNCPAPDIERWEAIQMHIRCPRCRKKAVDRNDHDYMECRECHTQYRRAYAGEFELLKTSSCVVLDNPLDSSITYFFILPEKGKGDFAIDKALKAARARFQEMATRRQRRRKR